MAPSERMCLKENHTKHAGQDTNTHMLQLIHSTSVRRQYKVSGNRKVDKM